MSRQKSRNIWWFEEVEGRSYGVISGLNELNFRSIRVINLANLHILT